MGVGERAAFSVFAFWLVPSCAERAATVVRQAFDAVLPPLPASAGPADYELLGFDVVDVGPFLPPFGRSLLASHEVAAEAALNRWQLLDECERAVALAARWNPRTAVREPSAYQVVRVARRPAPS